MLLCCSSGHDQRDGEEAGDRAAVCALCLLFRRPPPGAGCAGHLQGISRLQVMWLEASRCGLMIYQSSVTLFARVFISRCYHVRVASVSSRVVSTFVPNLSRPVLSLFFLVHPVWSSLVFLLSLSSVRSY